MRLYETMMTDCTKLERVTEPDELGGFKSKWEDAETFRAAIVKGNTSEKNVAQKNGVEELYTITVSDASLKFHDVFRRDSDDAIFRVTSNAYDSESPQVATFAIRQVTAERWVLT